MKRFVMKRFWVIMSVIIVLYIASIISVHVAYSAEPIEEQVIKLPQDGEKWFISVIGVKGERQYEDMLKWFKSDQKLIALRKQVHYWNVPTDSPDYRERYAKNTKVLPTIRVQEHDGDVVYERGDGSLPATSKDLYREISLSSTQAISGRWRDRTPFLPWRFNNKKCPDGNCPTPDQSPAPTPIPLDPEPDPLDDGGPPAFEEEEGPPAILKVLAAVASAVAGGGWGLFSQYKKVSGGE